MREWISTKDRLPVKTSSHGSEQVLAWIATQEGIGYFKLAQLNHQNIWVEDDFETLIEYEPGVVVCYWQRLTEPIKEQP